MSQRSRSLTVMRAVPTGDATEISRPRSRSVASVRAHEMSPQTSRVTLCANTSRTTKELQNVHGTCFCDVLHVRHWCQHQRVTSLSGELERGKRDMAGCRVTCSRLVFVSSKVWDFLHFPWCSFSRVHFALSVSETVLGGSRRQSDR